MLTSSRLGAAACFFVSALWSTPGQAAASKWVGDGGQVTYTVTHKFHEVHGTSKDARIVGVLDEHGLKIMARIAVKSFDSGNQNRDAHVLEVVDAPKFPEVTVRALAPDAKAPTKAGTQSLPVDVEVELHGVKTQHKVVAQVVLTDASHAKVTLVFDDSLTAHQIERPALLFVPVNDELHLEAQLSLHISQD